MTETELIDEFNKHFQKAEYCLMRVADPIAHRATMPGNSSKIVTQWMPAEDRKKWKKTRSIQQRMVDIRDKYPEFFKRQTEAAQ